MVIRSVVSLALVIVLLPACGGGSSSRGSGGDGPDSLAAAVPTSSLTYGEASDLHIQAQTMRMAMLEGDETIDPYDVQLAFDEATDAYQELIAAGNAGDMVVDVHMFLADAAFHAKRYEESAEAYNYVATSDEPGEWLTTAAHGEVVAWEHALQAAVAQGSIESDASPLDAGNLGYDIPAERAMPAMTQSWVQAAERYIDEGIETSDFPYFADNLHYQLAVMHIRFGQIDPAPDYLYAVLDNCSADTLEIAEASYSTLSWLSRDGADAVEAMEALETYEICFTPEFTATMREQNEQVIMNARVDAAMEMFEAGEYADAAEEYLWIAENYPDDPNVTPLCLFNAAIAKYNLAQRGESRELLQRVVDEWPQSDLAADAQQTLNDM